MILMILDGWTTYIATDKLYIYMGVRSPEILKKSYRRLRFLWTYENGLHTWRTTHWKQLLWITYLTPSEIGKNIIGDTDLRICQRLCCWAQLCIRYGLDCGILLEMDIHLCGILWSLCTFKRDLKNFKYRYGFSFICFESCYVHVRFVV